MMANVGHTEFFVFPDREVSQLLAENDLSIDDLLKSLDQPIASELRSDPASDESEGQSRELVTVLVAAAGLIAMATPLLQRALEQIARRPAVVSEMILVPVESTEGKIVRDSKGEPVLHWMERKRLLPSSASSPPESFKASVDGPLGLRIRLQNERGQ